MPCDLVPCPINLPIDRVVRMEIEDNTAVFDKSCMEAQILLTDDAGLVDGSVATSGDYLTPTSRVRIIGSLADSARHWDKSTETYRAVKAFFEEPVRPSVLKIGLIDFEDGGETPVDALDEIVKCDNCFYTVTHVHSYLDDTVLCDNPLIDVAAEWCQANKKLILTDSRDVNFETATDTTNIGYRLWAKGLRRSAVFYHEGWCEEIIDNTGAEIGTKTVYPYLSVKVGAYITGTDLNDEGSAYTLKFKSFTGIRTSNKTADIVTAVTGFIPGTGLDKQVGHFGNMFTLTGGERMLEQGTTSTGHFIDIVHALDWLAVQAQQRIFHTMTGKNENANSRKIPYTERGMAIIDAGLIDLGALATTVGIISDDEGTAFSTENSDGEQIGAFSVKRGSVNSQPVERRAQRISPSYRMCFRVAGAVHFVDGTICAFA